MASVVIAGRAGLVCLVVGGALIKQANLPLRRWLIPTVVTTAVVTVLAYFTGQTNPQTPKLYAPSLEP